MIVRKPTGSGREPWMLKIWVRWATFSPALWRMIAWLSAEIDGGFRR